MALAGQYRTVRADHRSGNRARAGFGGFVNQIEVVFTNRGGLFGKRRFKCTFFGGYRIARHDLRQAAFVFIFVVAAFFINLQKPVKHHNLTRGAQTNLTIGRGHFNRRAFHPGGSHLAGNRAFPDQFIQFALIGFGQAQIIRCRRHISRADTFMRLLRILGLVFVDARRIGHIGRTEPALDLVTRLCHRFGGHINAVGPHIGDVARLIQPLCRRHARFGPHAKFAAGLLLQG